MSNDQWWFESPSKRLALWRDFRKNLDTNDIMGLCTTVIDWWQTAPLVSIAIDPDNISGWPTPWELLHRGDFCENSLALGMSYTIYYANSNIKNELVYVTDKKKSIEKLCALIDNKHLLNYERDMISNFTDLEDVTFSYRVNINEIVG